MHLDGFVDNGYACVPGVVSEAECQTLCETVRRGASLSGGSRALLSEDWCAALAHQLRANPGISTCLPPDAVAVQCTCFEKSTERNWLVAIHQDLSIPVRRRQEAAGYTRWSVKEGTVFVQPPRPVLESLVAVRLHLDPCGPDDGPLKVIPRTHTLGVLSASDAARMRQTEATVLCTMETGGTLVMRPLLLHASSKSTGHSRRRVLHFLFGPRTLPTGMQWQHAV